LRRVDGAAADDYLAIGSRLDGVPVLRIGHTYTALAVEEQRRRKRVGLDAQVGAAKSRLEIGGVRTVPCPVLLGDAVESKTFLTCTDLVCVQFQPGLLASLHKRQRERVRIAEVRHVDRAAAAVKL
jgi:hypothetical protein